jgi:tetratricopeptide (TPR) repeat protein
MQISTDIFAIGSLVSLYETIYRVTTPASVASGTTSSFGPATLLSLGQDTSQTSITDTYSFLASAGLQTQATTSTAVYSAQQEEEQDVAKQANYRRVNGDYEGARSLLEAYLEKHRTSAIATQGLGAVELDLGHYEKAEQYFRKAHYLGPEYGFDSDVANAQTLQKDDDYVLEQAEKLSARSDTRDQARRLLVALTDRSPSNAVARALLAETLIRSGEGSTGLAQYQLAISSADRAQLQDIESRLVNLVEEAPTAAYLRNLLGQTELRLGEHEQAAETLALATSLSGDDPLYEADEALAHVALGRDAIARGDVTAAMGEFRAAYELDPTGEEVSVGLAEGYLARGQWLARISDAGGAIDEYLIAKDKLGSIENDELREELAAAVYGAGRTLERRRLAAGDDVGDELDAFQAAYELDSDNRTYRNKLAETHSTIGDQYLADGDLNEAAQSYQRAYEANSSNTAYRDSAIDAYVAYGVERSAAYDHHAAIAAYQAAFDLDRWNETAKSGLAEAYNTRGLLYKSLGEDYYSEAAADFLAALDLYPNNSTYQDNYDSVT